MLEFPFPIPPEPGELKQIEPSVCWARIPLPFQLDHVNVYLLADGSGWTVLDTGVDSPGGREAWTQLLDGPLRGERINRVLVSHVHPDHIGLAGWLCERFDAPLFIARSAYYECLTISLNPNGMAHDFYAEFYRCHGLAEETIARVATQGHKYLEMVHPLPMAFRSLNAGDVIDIGDRRFDVMTGHGHSPDQIMLSCPEAGVFFAADQVIPKISPNISVWASEPDGNPLDHYIRSLRQIMAEVDGSVLVLPGHRLPFIGLHERCRELIDHHEERCALILDVCAGSPMTVAELIPLLFNRALDPQQVSFAFSEALAHVNFLLGEGKMERADNVATNVIHYRAIR